MTPASEPGHDCPRCPRLVTLRERNRAIQPDWHNGPVPAFGGLDAWLLIVGLAPGQKGANRTGRPFTGDYAGRLLYPTLLKFGLAAGTYDERPDDGLRLIGTRITNSVRCVPPANKPLPNEIKTCLPFLDAEIAAMTKLRVMVALGAVAHTAVLRMMKLRQVDHKFAHGARHALPHDRVLFDSYHCSRYNTQTGVLTPAMFEAVFQAAVKLRP
ncbi:MAG: uracil-DNA glycosylase [Rhodospirillales bacterium]|nr:uracil-DNA glycosylase [Rhodospirillales bacterium]